MKDFYRFVIIFLVLITKVSTAQWEMINGPALPINCFAISDPNIFAGVGTTGGVYLSTNNGINWNAVNNGLPIESYVLSIATSGSSVFAGMFFSNGSLYLSTNNGANWNQMNNGLPNTSIVALSISGTNIFAGTSSEGVYLSTNNGANWNSVNNGLPTTPIVLSLIATSGSNIFVATSDGVYLSTNNGTIWSPVNNGLTNIASILIASGSNIFAGSNGSVFLSTNSGTNWNSVNNGLPTNPTVACLASSGSNVFTGLNSLGGINGVYLSTNNGTSWLDINQGLTSRNIYSLGVSQNYIYANIGASVWRRALSEIIGIQSISSEIPDGFYLSQNYPNPFNPVTNIKFDIPKKSFVKLLIYNSLGKEVATLVNEELNAGSFQANWDVREYQSGVYFYRLEMESFMETKRMVLLK